MVVVIIVRRRYKHVSGEVPDLKTHRVQVVRKHKHFKNRVMTPNGLDTGHCPRSSEEDTVAPQETEGFDVGLQE